MGFSPPLAELWMLGSSLEESPSAQRIAGGWRPFGGWSEEAKGVVFLVFMGFLWLLLIIFAGSLDVFSGFVGFSMGLLWAFDAFS